MSVRSSQGGMAEAFLHPSVGRNLRLEAIDGQIDWSHVDAVLAGLRASRMGPPRYPALLMFKALLLQQWYALSDPGLEEALCDRMSFRRFVGLAGDQAAPDHATLWRFRQNMAKAGLDHAVFEVVAGALDAQGLIIRQGTLIDASLVASQSRPPAPPADAAKDDAKGKDGKDAKDSKDSKDSDRSSRARERDANRDSARARDRDSSSSRDSSSDRRASREEKTPPKY